MSEICPCGSGAQYSDCCQPYLNGRRPAPTPGKLMRSRYTAYVKQDAGYLVATWHPGCNAENELAAIEGSFAHTDWLGLRIIDESVGKRPDEAFVEFFARFHHTGGSDHTQQGMHERSRFIRLDKRWYYIDGVRPQIGRNDLCPCGSGKKYKKCCGR